MAENKNLDEYIGMRCNVKGMDLVKISSPDIFDARPYPLEFVIVGHEKGKILVTTRHNFNYTWKVKLSMLYNLS